MRRGPVHTRGARSETGSGTPWPVRLAACALWLSLAPLAACDGGDAAPPAPATRAPHPVFVELVTLVPEPVSDQVALTGQLDAEYTGTVKAESSGTISSIEFKEGQTVKKGDVLFRLDDREQQALLMEAEAEQRLAQDVFDRTRQLTSQDVSSIARKNEAAANLDKAKARTALARVQLDRTRIRAPFDGVVGIRVVAPGDLVEEEDPLTQILAIDRLQAIFTVQEQGVPLARVGLPVRVRVVAYPGESFPGEVYFVAPNLDAAARRLILKAWIENADHRLKPGMFVNVDVEIARKDAALMIPETAVVYDRNGIFVWRSGEESRAEKVPVELGIRQEGRVEVVSGLEPGDEVVSAGTHKVLAGSVLKDPHEGRDGAAVHAREEPEAPGEGDAS